MAGTAKKSNPKLWETVKAKVTKSAKGGKPGQWSARKAQMAVAEYKKAGGGYAGRKSADNHLQQWQDEDWGTKSGKESRDTGERYLSTPLFEPFGADMNEAELALSRSTPGYQLS